MEKIAVLLALTPPIIIFIAVVSFIVYSIWYNKNYKTTEQTSEHDKGWYKCWDCKNAESTMYFDYNIFGRIYRCGKCSGIKNK